MQAFLVILLTLFTTMTTCYSQAGYITGRVYCQFSKETLQNAKIILKKDNKYLTKTKTDHAGNYWFGKLKKGNYTIWILHEGYCQLEMGRITLSNNSSIELDLGLMQNATNSNVATNGKIYMLYHKPISVNLTENTNYQNYKNKIQIISEVYNGIDICIVPKTKPIARLEMSRIVHNYESFKSLEKSSTLIPSGH